MKKAHEIISKIKAKLFSEEFKDKHKIKPQYFIRKSILNFTNLAVMILNGVKKSLQVELFTFGKLTSLPIVTKQAFSQARKKISSEVFKDLNNELIFEFYSNNKIKTWNGFVVYAADGTTLQLPDNEEIRKKYGVSTNHTESVMTMGRANHIYDVLNGITVAAELTSFHVSEKESLYSLLNDLKKIKEKCNQEKILLLLDRGYPCYVLFFLCLFLGIDFVARCKKDFSTIIKKILKSGKKDLIVKNLWKNLNWRHRRDLKKLGIDIDELKTMTLRVLVLDLKNGEKEILITSLINQKEYKYDCFLGLYFMRWGIEENYKFYKIRIEIENFSGFSVQAIEQDFYATILSSNIRSLIANEAHDMLEENKNPDRQYEYKINKNVSMGALKDEIFEILFNPRASVKRFCERIKKRMILAAVSIRPGREYKRNKKNSDRKYHVNQRRCF